MSLVFFFFGFFTPTVMHGYMNLKQIFRAKSRKSEQQKKKILRKWLFTQIFCFVIVLQRALRLADAKAVEAKAARIKDWVTNKLRELEDQNAHLKVQNAKANDQMELLRNRLEQLQVLGATTKSRQDSMAEVIIYTFKTETVK